MDPNIFACLADYLEVNKPVRSNELADRVRQADVRLFVQHLSLFKAPCFKCVVCIFASCIRPA